MFWCVVVVDYDVALLMPRLATTWIFEIRVEVFWNEGVHGTSDTPKEQSMSYTVNKLIFDLEPARGPTIHF